MGGVCGRPRCPWGVHIVESRSPAPPDPSWGPSPGPGHPHARGRLRPYGGSGGLRGSCGVDWVKKSIFPNRSENRLGWSKLPENGPKGVKTAHKRPPWAVLTPSRAPERPRRTAPTVKKSIFPNRSENRLGRSKLPENGPKGVKTREKKEDKLIQQQQKNNFVNGVHNPEH